MSEIGDMVTAIYNKLPTNYIMGSSVQSDKDDEIDLVLEYTGTTIPALIATISADTGKVVYGSVYSSTGEKKTISAGSVTGFVSDEKEDK